MSKKNKLEQVFDEAPSWLLNLLPVISAVIGVIVLWATWYFYKDVYTAPSFRWYNWLQPALLVSAGLMCLIASRLLANRKTDGWDYLWLAISMVPIILALRLVIVIVRFIGFTASWLGDNVGQLADGTILDRISLSPLNIANIVVVLVIVLFALLRRVDKSENIPKEKK
ncbi:hypothetical protein E4K67_24935 [Desulfosporosinus fructosivorans]|uniref:Uncharacterized protein n=1 Tax=Desulfosporosinus fructosivorans TaxID=2018669 RepID=A0A4Z0QYM4_9FIRM|nr:hypothetical protein [Desulfosporosinus fructosivorans]TGE35564.1 hypothetical protein E4K67_24935 [Desulfosporosinus fructosivorans]